MSMSQTLEELRNAPPAKLHISPPSLEEMRRWVSWPLAVPIPTTRYVVEHDALPLAPPSYTSIFDDVFMQAQLFKRQEKIRAAALFPVRLKAGQQLPPNGALGLHATPRQENLSVLGADLGYHPLHVVPEARGGSLLAVST